MQYHSTNRNLYIYESLPCVVVSKITMEGADPEVANWSEKMEDLLESGDIDLPISFLETLIQKLQNKNSTMAELQLSLVLFELAKLYDSKGFSIRADEARSRALAIKNRDLRSLLPHQASYDRETAREESKQVRVSIEGELYESCHSTKDVSVNDGIMDTSTKSIGDGQSGEASSDDDWEARADDAPDELLPTQQLPEVSKITLEDVVEAPKRRGRGTFSYKKEFLYSDQLAEESTLCDSEQMCEGSAKQDSTVKDLAYGTRHVLVLDGFEPSFNTMNLENLFKNYKNKFAIRWVNDTVALAVFRSPSVALEALNSVKCGFSVRLLEEDDSLLGSIQNRVLEPPKQRPQTSARTAQRLIAQGMGIKIPRFGSNESRRQEEARKNQIIARQNLKDDAWGADD